MSLSTSRIPGVHWSSQVWDSPWRLGGAAAIGQGESLAPGEPVLIQELHQAEGFGKESHLYQMVEVLLEMGVSPVYAIPAGEDASAAFAALENLPVGAAAADQWWEGLPALLNQWEQAGISQLVFIGLGLEEAAEAAETMNCQRVCVTCGGETALWKTGAALAAAALAWEGEGFHGKALPLQDFDGLLEQEEQEALLAAGVTPIVRYGQRVECVRGVTTRTRNDQNQTDLSGYSLWTVMALDQVSGELRQAAAKMIGGRNNSPEGRQSIVSRLLMVLENQKRRGLLEAYHPPVALPHPEDPGICLVRVSLKLASELSGIYLDTQLAL